MCCHGGPMQLDEYRKEVSDIYNIYQTIFEKSQDDEVYEAILEFRDDEDLIGWGIWNKVFKSFYSVKNMFSNKESLWTKRTRSQWSIELIGK